MINPYDALVEFHETFGLNVNKQKPEIPEDKERALRLSLMQEEVSEYLTGEAKNDLENIAKELCDIIYIAYGTAVSYGIPMDKVFEEVHRSNMSKVNPDGTISRREDGKVLKPATYKPANIQQFIH